jgi:hypothetical protein
VKGVEGLNKEVTEDVTDDVPAKLGVVGDG